MNEERMLILKMVSEGKITPEEAASLLRTLEEIDEPIPEPSQQSTTGNWQENVFDVLKSGAETLKKQALTIKADALKNRGKFFREQKHLLKQTLGQAKRDIGQASKEFKRIVIETEEADEPEPQADSSRFQHGFKEPRQEKRIETAERVNLKIEHQHGDIEVVSWTENAVLVEYQKTVWAENEEMAREIASGIHIQIESDDAPVNGETLVSIKTIYPEERNLWQGARHARVDYRLQVPHQTSLRVNNRHGQASVRDLHGTVTIEHQHGNVSIHGIDGDLDLNVHHGNADADAIQGNVLLKGAHGQAHLSRVQGSVESDRAHGNQQLHEIQGDVMLTHRHGNLEADGIRGKIRLDKHYGRIELRGVCDTFHIDAHHATLLIRVESALNGDCVIKGHHTPVDLTAPAGTFASIQASTHHGTIVSEFEGTLIKDRHDQQFIATSHESGANLQVEAHHGNIALRRHAEAMEGEGNE